MCVFSELVQNTRDVARGDILELQQFRHARGFSAPAQPDCAVCIPDGAQLTVTGLSCKLRNRFDLTDPCKATFVIGDMYQGKPDRLRFEHGPMACLEELNRGTSITIVSLMPQAPVHEPEFAPKLRTAQRRMPALAQHLVRGGINVLSLFRL